ncbi:MAG: class I SAM-dependent methyltransferase [Deltaproteobacteria bacterium]|nr:MAG: class I SAM-dependent methyltransferase [Deltaproteobacteria bacterium]
MIDNNRKLLKNQAQMWDKLAEIDAELATDGLQHYNPHYSRNNNEYIQTLSGYFNPTAGKKLLDIGCGWGKTLISCGKEGMECWGLDISQVMLSKAKEKAEKDKLKIHLSLGNAAELPYKENSFNIVWGYAVLMHLPKSKAKETLEEIRRVLKSDGSAYLHFKNRIHLMSLVAWVISFFRKLLNKPISPIEIRRYHLSEIKKIVGKYFEQVEILADDFMIFPLRLTFRVSIYSDLFLTGVPKIKPDSLFNLLPTHLITLVDKFYDFLKRFANLHFPSLKWFCRDFIVIVSRPRVIK